MSEFVSDVVIGGGNGEGVRDVNSGVDKSEESSWGNWWEGGGIELLLFDGNGIHVHDWGLAVDTSEKTNLSSSVNLVWIMVYFSSNSFNLIFRSMTSLVNCWTVSLV